MEQLTRIRNLKCHNFDMLCPLIYMIKNYKGGLFSDQENKPCEAANI